MKGDEIYKKESKKVQEHEKAEGEEQERKEHERIDKAYTQWKDAGSKPIEVSNSEEGKWYPSVTLDVDSIPDKLSSKMGKEVEFKCRAKVKGIDCGEDRKRVSFEIREIGFEDYLSDE